MKTGERLLHVKGARKSPVDLIWLERVVRYTGVVPGCLGGWCETTLWRLFSAIRCRCILNVVRKLETEVKHKRCPIYDSLHVDNPGCLVAKHRKPSLTQLGYDTRSETDSHEEQTRPPGKRSCHDGLDASHAGRNAHNQGC